MNKVLHKPAIDDKSLVAERLTLRGCVQGMGVRPAIYRLATRLELAGTVRNTYGGVFVEVEGASKSIAAFISGLDDELPAGCRIDAIERENIPPPLASGFVILHEDDDAALSARIPVDRAICEQCLGEVFSPSDHRSGYPLTTCTQCGPRYSVIRAMPFERQSTTLDKFPLCEKCREEYESPNDRRFHAQTIGCPSCGPEIWATFADGRQAGRGSDSLDAAVELLREGKILALRGVGGYQLLVDATDEESVNRLRARKRRAAKPLAVMVASLAEANALAWLNDAERRELLSPANPIVVVSAKEGELARAVHPRLNDVGLLLPTTPLHALLLHEVRRPLICTSGNREGEPLEIEIDAAERNLRGIADVWLHHDRPIAHSIDDSVVRVIASRPVTLRLGRGLAPLPLEVPHESPMLATGGHLKCSLAWSNGAQAVLGPHIGDQESLAARRRYIASVEQMERLYQFKPAIVVHDAHPDYFTSTWAQRSAQRRVAVQHHHAHVVAGMIEHGWLDRTVLGVSWDGTGYGTDGSIWGGEFMLADVRGSRRVAHLRPFRLPGGDAAVREPWRIAVSMIQDAAGADVVANLPWQNVKTSQMASLLRVAAHPRLAPVTTSAGRLFDAAACLILEIVQADFDGQAAMCLEAACDPSDVGHYQIDLVETEGLIQLDWRPLMRQLLSDLRQGVDCGSMAMRFHRGVARAIAEIARRFADLPIVLGGGVFQNRVLVELLLEMFDGRLLGLPGVIPPGDGGLAAGQLAVAAMHREQV